MWKEFGFAQNEERWSNNDTAANIISPHNPSRGSAMLPQSPQLEVEYTRKLITARTNFRVIVSYLIRASRDLRYGTSKAGVAITIFQGRMVQDTKTPSVWNGSSRMKTST